MGGFNPDFGVKISGIITPTSSGDSYATHDSFYGQGGWKEVADLTERDSITPERRKEGMITYVVATSTAYQLIGGVENTDWTIFTAGGGGASTAVTTTYDNTTSGMTATDVQVAIDEVEARVDTIETNTTGLDNDLLGTKAVDETDLADGKILKYDLATDSLVYVTNSGGSAGEYTNADPIVTAIGGVEAGETFTAIALQDMWTKLLYPYQYPTFSSFSITGVNTVYEVGDTITGQGYDFVWGTTNPTNIEADTIEIVDVTNANNVLVTASADDSLENLAQVAVVKTTADSHQWKITGTDTKTNTFNKTFTVNWQHRIYYGESALSTVTETDIKALRVSELKSTRTGTYSFDGGGYKWYCIEDTMGTPSLFKDPLTQLEVAFNAPIDVSVTNDFGVVMNYKCYRTVNTLGGAIDVVVN